MTERIDKEACRDAFKEWWKKWWKETALNHSCGRKQIACKAYEAGNRRSGGPMPYGEYRGALRMAIESKATLRSAVKQVRDEVKRITDDLPHPGYSPSSSKVREYRRVEYALTRILDEPETETDKFKRKTKPVTTRIGKD